MWVIVGIIFFVITGVVKEYTENIIYAMLITIGIMVAAVFLYIVLRQVEEGKKEAEKEKLHEATVVESQQKALIGNITYSNQLVANMPALIAEAEKHLDKAEDEFVAGVFAPFWDEIENAANKLASYNQNLVYLAKTASSCNDQAALLPPSVRPFSLSKMKVHDARPTTYRLTNLVRKAQGNFHFATIFEQRKTNKLLYQGFESLGHAINSMGNQISSSLGELSNSLNVSLDDILQTARKDAAASRQFEQDSFYNK